MNVRLAVEADLPRIVEMGRRFRAETSYSRYLADNPRRVLDVMGKLLAQGGLLVGVEEGSLVGFLGFLTHEHFFSGEKVTGEIVWWMEPEYRGEGLKLLEEMKRLGREAGATYYQVGAPSERVVRLYRKLGLEFVEATFQGNL